MWENLFSYSLKHAGLGRVKISNGSAKKVDLYDRGPKYMAWNKFCFLVWGSCPKWLPPREEHHCWPFIYSEAITWWDHVEPIPALERWRCSSFPGFSHWAGWAGESGTWCMVATAASSWSSLVGRRCPHHPPANGMRRPGSAESGGRGVPLQWSGAQGTLGGLNALCAPPQR